MAISKRRKPKIEASAPATDDFDANFLKQFARSLKTEGEDDEPSEDENPWPPKPTSSMAVMADAVMAIEKHRVSLKVRSAHLSNDGRTDPDTQELIKRILSVEEWAKSRLAKLVVAHPTYAWWSRITGIPALVMAKLLGEIELFGRWYPVGDPMVPSFVARAPVKGTDSNMWVWVEGIERLMTPSKLMKYAGLVPGQKAEMGKLLGYNKRLKMIVFRLREYGIIFKKNRYTDFYRQYKAAKQARLTAAGVQIIATPTGRWCATCRKAVVTKAARLCPTCNVKLENKQEPEGTIFKGHLDAQCRRRAVKLFLCHLWLVWREALKLPTRAPYPIEKMGADHATLIRPEQMVDKPLVPAVA